MQTRERFFELNDTFCYITSKRIGYQIYIKNSASFW